MCTLAVSFYPKTECPLIIAANRDENPERPSEPWTLRNNNKIFSPLDVRKGTWIGCNDKGVFAAITNWDIEPDLHGLLSRGIVVMNILKCKTMSDIIYYLCGINAKDYNSFNIIFGNKDVLQHFSCDHKKTNLVDLQSGLHISTGWGVNTNCKREEFIKSELQKKFNRFEQPIAESDLQKCMMAHNDGIGSDHSICVHDDNHEWETRSSVIMMMKHNTWFVKYVDTAPCCADNWNTYELEVQ